MDKIIDEINLNWDSKPSVVTDKIAENCIFENSKSGQGTLIIDKSFMDSMTEISNKIDIEQSIVAILGQICLDVNDYYYAQNNDEAKSRQEVYSNSFVTDVDGMIIGTKISSLKGKNIAKCSEKSIAAYIILKNLYENNILKYKPTMILSHLRTEDEDKSEPHAFLTLSKEDEKYPSKHILFDIQNPSKIKKNNEEEVYFPGMYAMTDEENNDINNGYECSPTSYYECFGKPYKEVGVKRIYGGRTKTIDIEK